MAEQRRAGPANTASQAEVAAASAAAPDAAGEVSAGPEPAEVRWVSNRKAPREAFASLKSDHQLNLNTVASGLASEAFRMAGRDIMPRQVWVAWEDRHLLISAREIRDTDPFAANWSKAATPTLRMYLALAMREGRVSVPSGMIYRMPVAVYDHPSYGPMVRVNFTRAVAVQSARRVRRTEGKAAG